MQTNIFPAVRLAVAAVAVLSGAAVLNGLTTPHTQTAKNVNVPVVVSDGPAPTPLCDPSDPKCKIPTMNPW